MIITIGYLKSESQFSKIELNYTDNTVKESVHDTVEIKETPFNLFIINESFSEGLETTFEKEEKHYPMISEENLKIDHQSFIKLSFDEINNIYTKVNNRWVLKNNMSLIENNFSHISRLKSLWTQDRSAFFEELWFSLKVNTSATALNIIFHDVKEPQNPEKSDKHTLIYSYVKGDKLPQIFEGKENETKVMEAYSNEFSADFKITEFDSTTGNMVACVKIGLSPILIMGKIPELNQIQISLLTGLFNGLKEV